jgi:putative polyhydroxyalkanoate system protein
MATITIDRTHGLPHDEARNLAAGLATDLAQRYGFAWHWEDDDIRFQWSGVSGRLHIGPSQIRLDMKLGLLLAPFRSSIEQQVNAELDRLTGGTTAA